MLTTADDWVAAACEFLRERGLDPTRQPEPEKVPDLDIYVRPFDPIGWLCFNRFCTASGTGHPDAPALVVALTACDEDGRRLFGTEDVPVIADRLPPFA